MRQNRPRPRRKNRAESKVLSSGSKAVLSARHSALRNAPIERLEERRLLAGDITGYSWEDLNGNAVRDPSIVVGDRPDVVFVVDASAASLLPAGAGFLVGDLNFDGKADTYLDAQLAAFISLNQDLINRGMGDTARVAIVKMTTQAVSLDMNPLQAGSQFWTTPLANADQTLGNIELDVEQVLYAIRGGGAADWSSALQRVNADFVGMGTLAGQGTMVFLAASTPTNLLNYIDDAQTLADARMNLRPYGIGTATLASLSLIDRNNATVLPTIPALLTEFAGPSVPPPTFTEPGLPDWTIYLDLDANGQLDPGEPTTLTDINGDYFFTGLTAGTYVVGQVGQAGWLQTNPHDGRQSLTAPQDAHVTVTVEDFQTAYANFGNTDKTGTVSGVVWHDLNDNGFRDGGNLSVPITLAPIGAPVLPRGDDNTSGELPLGFTFDFYGTSFTSFYINNNGNVTFGSPTIAFTSQGFPYVGPPMIAPFWSDVDTRNALSGRVCLTRGTSERGNPFVQVDWSRVGYFSNKVDKLNDFTLYLEDDPGGDIVAFFYRNMRWTTGDVTSPGRNGYGAEGAQIGFDSGNGVNYLSHGRPNSLASLQAYNNTSYTFVIANDGSPYLEPPLAGWTVYLDLNNNRLREADEPTSLTDVNGAYSFTGLAPGSYVVAEEPLLGWAPTGKNQGRYAVVAPPGGDAKASFGNVEVPVMSVSDVSVLEGDDGTTMMRVTVSLSEPSRREVSVQYASADGSAIAGEDYLATIGRLIIPAGQTSATFTVQVIADSVCEPDETLSLTFSNITSAIWAGGPSQVVVTGTILNDDPTDFFRFDSSAYSFYESGRAVTVTVLRSASAPGVGLDLASVEWILLSDTGTVDEDAVAGSGVLTFAPGETSKDISIQLLDDTLVEGDECLTLQLRNPSPLTASVSDPPFTIITLWDDEQPAVSISDPQPVFEGDGPDPNNPNNPTVPNQLLFTVSLTHASGQDVFVDYRTFDGTALAGQDYLPATNTLRIPAGQTSATIAITIVGDTISEQMETFSLEIFNPTNATLDPAATLATGTIVDDETPWLYIDDARIDEGASGNTDLLFTVRLSNPTSSPVSVDFATAAIGGTATPGADFLPLSGTLTIPAGLWSQTIAIPIVGDALNELDETFFVNLSNLNAAANLADGQAVGTIGNDDPLPTLSLSANQTLIEGDGGLALASFTVSLSAPSGQSVSVLVASVPGTAADGSDYLGLSSTTLVFAPGQTSQIVSIPVLGDAIDEADETLTLALSAIANAQPGNALATLTIQDDDLPPDLAIADATGLEGSAAAGFLSFVVSLSAPSGQSVSVQYATVNNTARATSDYDAVSGTLVFAPNEVSRTILVPLIADYSVEPDERFYVNLSAASGATIIGAQAMGTILNDDVPQISISDATVTEGSLGKVNVIVSLSERFGQSVSVNWSTANHTALAGSDYLPQGGTLVFAPGDLTKTLSIQSWIIDDSVCEDAEDFYINLSGPTNAILNPAPGQAQAVVSIQDIDLPPILGVSGGTIREGNSGMSNATFRVTLSAPAGRLVSVNYTTASGSAFAGQDFQGVSGTLVFNGNETSKNISVPIIGDTLDEDDETFTLILSDPYNATLPPAAGDAQASMVILNDEPVPSVSIAPASMAEGDVATTNLRFAVSLSSITGRTVSVHYATANGTAAAGSDFIASNGVLTFSPGESFKFIDVPIKGDRTSEAKETFSVVLSNVSGASLGNSQAIGAIEDDDSLPELRLAMVSPKAEIRAGQRNAINFGSVRQGSAGATRSFRLTNAGSAPLRLVRPKLPKGYQLVDGLLNRLEPGESDVFVVRLLASGTGTRAGQITVLSNDPARNPFEFPVTGKVVSAKNAKKSRFSSRATIAAKAGDVLVSSKRNLLGLFSSSTSLRSLLASGKDVL